MSKDFISFAASAGPAVLLSLLIYGTTRDLRLSIIIFFFIWIIVSLIRTPIMALQKYQDIISTRLADIMVASKPELLIFQGKFSYSLRKYYQFILYRYRNLNLEGKRISLPLPYTLELDSVFVKLKVVPNAKPNVATLNHSFEYKNKTLNIWQCLEAEEISFHHLAIVGPPGSGKSTLLRHLALQLSGNTKEQSQFHLIPILLFIRNHAAKIVESIDKNEILKLPDIINEILNKADLEIPDDWIKAQLSANHCLIMLDGLDEVVDLRTREKVVQWVETQLYNYGGNRFIVTSRPRGYLTNPISNVTLLEIQPFDAIQQAQFIYKWYEAIEIKSQQRSDRGVLREANEAAEELLKRIGKSASLSDMAVNPFLLTLIATIHRFGRELPGRRVDLYAQICNVFLEEYQAVITNAKPLVAKQKALVLQELAFEMMKRNVVSIPLDTALTIIKEPLARVSRGKIDAKTFLKDIEDRSGLFIEQETEEYGFSHLTFQEYLAACHVKNNSLLIEIIASKVTSTSWHECIRLFCAQGDATKIVEACILEIKKGHPNSEPLVLGIECLEECIDVDPKIAEAFDKMIEEGIESDQPSIARYFLKGKLDLRINRMKPIREQKYIDTSFVSHGEYQLFLNETMVYKAFCQPKEWSNGRFPKGMANSPVQNIHPEAAIIFCAWLSSRYKGWVYRLPQYEERQFVENVVIADQANTLKWHTANNALNKELSLIPTLINSLDYNHEIDFNLTFYFTRDYINDLRFNQSLDFQLIISCSNNLLSNLNFIHNFVKTREPSVSNIFASAINLALTLSDVVSDILTTISTNPATLINAQKIIFSNMQKTHNIDITDQDFILASELNKLLRIAKELASDLNATLNIDIDLIQTLSAELNHDSSSELGRVFIKIIDHFSQRGDILSQLSLICLPIYTSVQILPRLVEAITTPNDNKKKYSSIRALLVSGIVISYCLERMIRDLKVDNRQFKEETNHLIVSLEAMYLASFGERALDNEYHNKGLFLLRDFVDAKPQEYLTLRSPYLSSFDIRWEVPDRIIYLKIREKLTKVDIQTITNTITSMIDGNISISLIVDFRPGGSLVPDISYLGKHWLEKLKLDLIVTIGGGPLMTFITNILYQIQRRNYTFSKSKSEALQLVNEYKQ